MGRRRPEAGWQGFGIGVRPTTDVRGAVGRWESLTVLAIRQSCRGACLAFDRAA